MKGEGEDGGGGRKEGERMGNGGRGNAAAPAGSLLLVPPAPAD